MYWAKIHPLINSLLLSGAIHSSLILSVGIVFDENLRQEDDSLSTILSTKKITPIGVFVKKGRPDLFAPVLRPKRIAHGNDKVVGSIEGNSDLKNARLDARGVQVGDPEGVVVSLKERYLYELRLFIENHKFYPLISKRRGEEGVVEVSFLVDRDGQISDIELIRPSHYERLNNATFELLERLEKFKAFPSELEAKNLRISQKIVYQLL